MTLIKWYQLVCDHCHDNTFIQDSDDQQSFIVAAEQKGWIKKNNSWICPVCNK